VRSPDGLPKATTQATNSDSDALPAVLQVVLEMLRRDPAARPQVATFRDACAAALGTVPSRAHGSAL
jgi:hypothetical protein